MYSISIIIPIYNEKENIDKLIYEINTVLNNQSFNYEIIIINDASEDLDEDDINFLSKLKNTTIFSNKYNKGQSFSLIEGIKKSSYKNIVTIDGDGQNNPKDLPLLLNKYFSDHDLFLVGGIRFNRKDNLIKLFSSKIANNVRKYLLKDDCDDTGCSLKVFDKEVFMKFPEFRGIHRFLPALFKGYGKNTYFINVDHRPRIHGSSKYGTLSRLFIGIIDLIKVAKFIKEFRSKCD